VASLGFVAVVLGASYYFTVLARWSNPPFATFPSPPAYLLQPACVQPMRGPSPYPFYSCSLGPPRLKASSCTIQVKHELNWVANAITCDVCKDACT
jgi:hypothetical protein